MRVGSEGPRRVNVRSRPIAVPKIGRDNPPWWRSSGSSFSINDLSTSGDSVLVLRWLTPTPPSVNTTKRGISNETLPQRPAMLIHGPHGFFVSRLRGRVAPVGGCRQQGGCRQAYMDVFTASLGGCNQAPKKRKTQVQNVMYSVMASSSSMRRRVGVIPYRLAPGGADVEALTAVAASRRRQ
jgi:hypothetical protein